MDLLSRENQTLAPQNDLTGSNVEKLFDELCNENSEGDLTDTDMDFSKK